MISSGDCHYCLEKSQLLAKCCLKKCNKSYCLDCIRNHFNSSFEEAQYKRNLWICYSCQHQCSCSNCKPDQTPVKKEKKKVGKPPSKPNQESPEGQSNFSMSMNSKINDSMPMQTVQEGGSQANVIRDYRVHEKMLVSRDDIIMMPLFLQKIAKRRNMYFEFMSKNYKMQKIGKSEKVEKVQKVQKPQKIQNMVELALKQRSYDSDDMEILE